MLTTVLSLRIFATLALPLLQGCAPQGDVTEVPCLAFSREGARVLATQGEGQKRRIVLDIAAFADGQLSEKPVFENLRRVRAEGREAAIRRLGGPGHEIALDLRGLSGADLACRDFLQVIKECEPIPAVRLYFKEAEIDIIPWRDRWGGRVLG